MGVMQSLIRARGGAFPISVVFSGSTFYQGSGATFTTIAPDPGTVDVGDVVLVHLAVQNGRPSSAPNPFPPSAVGISDGVGWSQLVFTTTGTNGEFGTYIYAIRATSTGTISAEERTFDWFVNTVNSQLRVSTVVVRGVRNGGLLGFDVTPRTGSIVSRAGAIDATLQNGARSAATMLALHFCHVNSGTFSGAPAGWTSVHEVTDSGGTVGGGYYIESAQYSSTGTTNATARTTCPLRRATALVHFIAP